MQYSGAAPHALCPHESTRSRAAVAPAEGEQQGAEKGEAQPKTEGDGADDVTDVDFEEVKEDK